MSIRLKQSWSRRGWSRIARMMVSAPVPRAAYLPGILLLTLIAPVYAVTVNDLYSATVHIKDRSDAARSAAFVSALSVVLTKVSGRSDAAARVGAPAQTADRYVQRYSYLPGGQLEVGFDGATVNNLLEKTGLPLWDRERPTTLVIYPESLQGLREATMATEHTARVRGVPIVWASRETSEQVAPGTAQLLELARRYDAVAVLLARVGPAGPSAASLRWQMVFNGSVQEQMGSAEEGPNLAADVLARYYAAAGKDATQLEMDVAAVTTLDAYANTLGYLNALLMVRSVSVASLQRDVLHLRIEVRGSEDALRRALAIDQKLVEVASNPDAAFGAIQANSPALSYRYNN